MADVASSLKNWSSTAASNSPTSATTIGTGLAPNFQQIQATLRNELATRSAAVTAAVTTDIGVKDEGTVLVTNVAGTIAITSFGTVSAGIKKLVTFTVSGGSLSITYNATSMILPSSTSITVATGDSLLAESLGSGNWKIHAYYKQDGTTFPFIDSTAIVKGSADATKQLRIEVDGISTATTRVATTPNNDFTFDNSKIQPITASVAASALTLSLNPTTLDFRSATPSSGTVNTRIIAAQISLVISSGSTLGTANAVQSRIAVLAIDNAGTVELAAVNIAGGNDLSETGLISTTAEGGAGGADSINVIYSTTARASVPYRVVGYVESTQATAGTWATAPSTIQGVGGQALTALSSIGYGQTWQNVSGSRTTGTTYYNTTGKPIFVVINFYASGTGGTCNVAVSGATIMNGATAASTATNQQAYFIVPVGGSYTTTTVGGTTLGTWFELR
jgi:hypothetical protein